MNHNLCPSHTEPLEDVPLTDLLQKFWETESVPNSSPDDALSIDELNCERHFQETYSYYCVCIRVTQKKSSGISQEHG